MEEDMIKIEELEYFNPFVDINLQLLDLKNPNVFSCNFDEQQQLFIYMACSDDIKAKIISQIRPPQIILNRLMYPSKEELNNQYPMYKKSFTKRDVKKLNNVIKKFKTKIDKYIKSIKGSIPHVVLLDSLYSTNECIMNIQTSIDKLPYIYYLQETLRMFRLFNDAKNEPNELFDNWNKIFKLQKNIELWNFQGCLGLLLMNEFCSYYRKNQLNYCILCAMLMTILCIYSPVYKRIERAKSKKIKQLMENIQEHDKEYSTAGQESGRERGKYRKQGYEIWKENKFYGQKPSDIIDTFIDLYIKRFTREGLPTNKTIKEWFRYYKKNDSILSKEMSVERVQ